MLFSSESVQPVDTILELLHIVAQQVDASEPALSMITGEDETQRLSYEEYLSSIRKWSCFLSVNLKIKPGDRVATLLKNRSEVPIIYIALMCIGAVVVPLNPAYSAEEMDFVLTDSGAIGVLTDEATSSVVHRNFSRCNFVQDIDHIGPISSDNIQDVALTQQSPAITLYTSGTTAFPKGVVQTHGNLIANAWSMVKALGISKPVQLSVMPFYHAHAVGFGMMTCLLSGGHLLVAERMNPLAWPKIIQKLSVTLTSMVPNLLHLLERTRVRANDVPSLQYIFVSAAPLPSLLAKAFENRSGIKLAHAWGLSEFTNFATCLPPSLPDGIRTSLMFGEATPCVGSALEGVNVEVRRKDGSVAADGESGELWVSGPSLTLGYHNNPTATSEAIVDSWLRSGDEGYALTCEGNRYFFISDRIKDVIIRSGEKVSPMAVEAAIVSKLPFLVNNIVALGFEHNLYGEEIGLAVEKSVLSGQSDELAQAIGAMPVRQRPKVVLCGENIIPRTHTGKIQRRHLKPLFSRYANDPTAYRFEDLSGEKGSA